MNTLNIAIEIQHNQYCDGCQRALVKAIQSMGTLRPQYRHTVDQTRVGGCIVTVIGQEG